MKTVPTSSDKPAAPFPEPVVDAITKPYWDALREGVLTYQHCLSCLNNWLPGRSECPQCLQAKWEWVPASGRARLVSWVVFHRAFHPAFTGRLPYNVAVVELIEGPRLITNILVDDAETLTIDQPLVFVPAIEHGRGIARFKVA
jgi:uncharacterized OB-fold protein